MINRKNSEFLHYLVAPILALISAPLLANGLGASDRGMYSSIVNLCLLLAVALSYGLDILVASKQNTNYELWIIPNILRRYFFYLQILPILLTFSIIQFFYGEYFNVLNTILVSLTVPLLIVTNLTASYARNVRNLRMLGVIQSHSAVVRTFFIFLLFALGVLNVTSAIIFTFFANLYPLINVFKSKTSSRNSRVVTSKAYYGPQISQGLRVLPVSILTIATYRLDQILGLFIIGGSELGIYAVAVSICEIPLLLVRSYKDGLYKIEEKNVNLIIKTAISRMLVLSLFIALALPVFFKFILSSEYGSGLLVAETMLVVVFIQALFELNSIHLIRQNRFNKIIILQTIYLVMTLAIAMLFRHFGAMALVIGNFLGYTFSLLVLLIFKKTS